MGDIAWLFCYLKDKMCSFKSLPNHKILDWSKLEPFAADKLQIAKMPEFFFHRAENMVRKGENTGYQHFLRFSQCFQKVYSPGSTKPGIVW